MSTRRRLSPQRRRDELMDAGEDAFGHTAYDDVVLEDVARRANASRALMYHYFPTKGDLFAAIWRRAHDRLNSQVVVDGRPLREVVADALVRHLDFYQAHVRLVMIANRSSIAADPAVRVPIADGMRLLCDRILDVGDVGGHDRELASASLVGWIAYVREVTVEWLLHENISRTEVVALCMSVLDCTLGRAVDWTVCVDPGDAVR